MHLVVSPPFPLQTAYIGLRINELFPLLNLVWSHFPWVWSRGIFPPGYYGQRNNHISTFIAYFKGVWTLFQVTFQFYRETCPIYSGTLKSYIWSRIIEISKKLLLKLVIFNCSFFQKIFSGLVATFQSGRTMISSTLLIG